MISTSQAQTVFIGSLRFIMVGTSQTQTVFIEHQSNTETVWCHQLVLVTPLPFVHTARGARAQLACPSRSWLWSAPNIVGHTGD